MLTRVYRSTIGAPCAQTGSLVLVQEAKAARATGPMSSCLRAVAVLLALGSWPCARHAPARCLGAPRSGAHSPSSWAVSSAAASARLPLGPCPARARPTSVVAKKKRRTAVLRARRREACGAVRAVVWSVQWEGEMAQFLRASSPVLDGLV
jgi:hypothetical protein